MAHPYPSKCRTHDSHEATGKSREQQAVTRPAVVMPEHIHLLISEPEKGTPSTVMQVVKQRYAQRVLRKRRRDPAQPELWPEDGRHVWQRRFYDFNVWSEAKRIENLGYIHWNPVKRGLLAEPEQWA